MNKCFIREVGVTELEYCIEVIRQGFETVAKDFGLTENNCPSNGAFIKLDRLLADKNKGNYMYGLFSENKLIGFMQLEKKDDEEYELKNVTVLPSFRHNQYGEMLLQFAFNKVNELNGKKMTIGIIEDNTVLKQWYLKNGFTHTGTKKIDFLPFMVGFMEIEIN